MSASQRSRASESLVGLHFQLPPTKNFRMVVGVAIGRETRETEPEEFWVFWRKNELTQKCIPHDGWLSRVQAWQSG